MGRRNGLLVALALCCLAQPVAAQNLLTYRGVDGRPVTVSADNPVPVTGALGLPAGASTSAKQDTANASLSSIATNTSQSPVSAVSGTTSAVTVTNSSSQVAASASRRFLAISNESATASIACRFGNTAALNTAGSFMIPPLNTRVWSAYPVPADTINCISSAATSPATFEVN